MTSPRQRPQHPDSGASLIMAIGFVLMIGMVSGGLAGLATSGLGNRSTLQTLRDRQYAADGAIEQAIIAARPPTRTCASIESAAGADGPTLSTMNGISIRVDWVNACLLGNSDGVTASDGRPFDQRNVIFSACVDTGAACVDANVVIRAEVGFQQPSAGVIRTYVLSWSVNQ